MTSSKTVLITGTSSGIGRSTAQTLAQKGHTVFATMRNIDGKNATSAAELCDWAASEGLKLHVIELDVTDSASVQKAVQQVIDMTGRIDVLINNAGWGIFGISEAFTEEQTRLSAQEDIWNAYGPIGHAAKAMLDGLPAYFTMDMLSTSQSLSEKIAEYIEMPSGQRPLKVGLGLGTDGFDDVNEAWYSLQSKAIDAAGFGQFLKR